MYKCVLKGLEKVYNLSLINNYVMFENIVYILPIKGGKLSTAIIPKINPSYFRLAVNRA